MLMLAQVSVVLSNGGSSLGPSLCRHLMDNVGGTRISEVRPSPVLESWDGLTNVCKEADTVYLLSALDLPHRPNDSDLETFKTGVSRVLECCKACGVKSLVFTSSANVISREGGFDHISEEENEKYVTSQQDAKMHAVAMAEEEILKASGAKTMSEGSLSLHTCALRPATIYGTERDRLLHRALAWVGWGLNRLTVGPKDVKFDMVYADNLVEAQVLAGETLKEGIAPHPEAEAVEQNSGVPVSSGKAYFVTDGQPCNPQTFMDGIFGGLGFSTSKVLRVPTRVALFTALMAELAYKVGLTRAPLWTRADVRTLTENRTFSIARAKRNLGYMPKVEPATATKKTVDSLKRAGWSKHKMLIPSLGYWICNPVGIWLVTLAAFGGPCPAFLAPLAGKAEQVGLLLLHQQSAVRTVCVAVYLIHMLEGIYAYRVAQLAGHKDTAPRWFFQTFILGFPSIGLVNRLKSESS